MVLQIAAIAVMWLLPTAVSAIIALDGRPQENARRLWRLQRVLASLLGTALLHAVLSYLLIGMPGRSGFLRALLRGEATYQSLLRWTGVTALCLIASVGIGLLIRRISASRRAPEPLRGSTRRCVLLMFAAAALPLLLTAGFCADGAKHLSLQEICRKTQTVEGGKAYVVLKNEGTMPCEVRGMYLSSDEKALRAYRIPDMTLPAGGTAAVEDAEERFVSIRRNGGDTLYLSNASGTVLDSVELPALPVNTAYRLGEAGWISEPLPGTAQESAVAAPVFSAQGGFYDGEFELTLSAEPGCRIYYTLDGAVPDPDSTVYDAPVRIYDRSAEPNRFRSIRNVREDYLEHSAPGSEPVDKAMVVRAVAVDASGERSDVVTETYYIGLDQTYQDETVISIVADPEELFGEDGVYVTGAAYDAWYAEKRAADAAGKPFDEQAPTPNYLLRGPETERAANFEVYEQSRQVLNQPVGIRVQGNSSRHNPLKRFSIYARPMYSGSSLFDTQLFEGKRTHSVVLRQSVDNAISHNAAKGRDVAVLETRPVKVFLNGELWYNTFMQEKFSNAYFAETFGVTKSNVEFIAVGVWSKVPEADRRTYESLMEFADSRDMSDPENYAALGQIADLQSYIDYACIQVYLANADSHEQLNTCIWRTKLDDHSEYGDGRWRWALYDMDLNKSNYRSIYGLQTNAELNSFTATREEGFPALLSGGRFYESLKKSPDFCRQFVLTFMDLVNTNFSAEAITPVLEALGEDMSYDDYFFRDRFRYLSACLEEEFGLTGSQTELTLQSEQPDYGSIRLNTITPALAAQGWTGVYYTDYPVTLTAQPAEGHSFDHWEINGTVFTDPTVEVTLKEGGNTVHAIFR